MHIFDKLLVFVVGICLGSFLNVVIHRLPQKEKIFFDRSKCPKCGSPIKWYHNLPILSYLLLRGKCAYCQATISILYPVVELLTGTLLLLIYLKFQETLPVFFFLSLYLLFGISISFIDLKTKEIPDVLSLPLIPLGIVFSSLGINPKVSDFELSLVSSLAGIGLLFLINEIYYLLAKREGIGLGDLKLMAGIGSFFSYHSFYHVLLYASLIGIFAYLAYRILLKVSGYKHTKVSNNILKVEIPFGPFLFLGSLIYLFS